MRACTCAVSLVCAAALTGMGSLLATALTAFAVLSSRASCMMGYFVSRLGALGFYPTCSESLTCDSRQSHQRRISEAGKICLRGMSCSEQLPAHFLLLSFAAQNCPPKAAADHRQVEDSQRLHRVSTYFRRVSHSSEC